MSMLRLDPPIELDVPQGRAWAHFIVDYSQDTDIVWGCVIRETGEWWWVRNKEVRSVPCRTWGVRPSELPTDAPVAARYSPVGGAGGPPAIGVAAPPLRAAPGAATGSAEDGERPPGVGGAAAGGPPALEGCSTGELRDRWLEWQRRKESGDGER